MNLNPMTLTPLLQVRNLKKTYGQKTWIFSQPLNPVLNDVSFDLYPQETLAIVGESGCGKTTFAKCLLKIENYESGSIHLKNMPQHANRLVAVGSENSSDVLNIVSSDERMKDLKSIPQRELARDVQMVFQDPHSSLNPRKSIFEIITEPLIIFGQRSNLQEKAEEVLRDVGLSTDFLNKFPHMMSGGQKQRVALARALIYRPQILVCDEPVSALDVSIQAQVLNLLKDLQQKYQLSMIFISHDLSVVRYIAHRVAVFYKGELVELAKTETLFQNPQHAYTKHLLRSRPQFHRAKHDEK